MEERDPQLSEAYRAADHPEPSPALDARILEAARQAVAPTPRRRPAWRNWAVPLSTTAVLVLGITLLFQIQREAPETLGDAPPSPAMVRPESVPAPTADTQAGSAPKPAPAETAAKAAAAAVPSGTDHSREYAAPASALPPEPSRKAMSAPPAGNLGEDRARMERSAPSPAAAGAAAPAFGQGLDKLKADSTEREGPEQWVESIRRLMKVGRTDEARNSLEELRKRYPEFVLPEDLRGLADK